MIFLDFDYLCRLETKAMAHTSKDKKKLLARVRRIRGQVEAIERAIEQEKECSSVLLTVAACRGAMNSLMAEILEGHIRHHVLDADGKSPPDQVEAAEEVIELVRRYLK
jgi:DNA-binding FrmR family transcriptional regulator